MASWSLIASFRIFVKRHSPNAASISGLAAGNASLFVGDVVCFGGVSSGASTAGNASLFAGDVVCFGGVSSGAPTAWRSPKDVFLDFGGGVGGPGFKTDEKGMQRPVNIVGLADCACEVCAKGDDDGVGRRVGGDIFGNE